MRSAVKCSYSKGYSLLPDELDFWPLAFDKSMAVPSPTPSNMFVSRVRYTTSIESYMPENSVYITAMRNPMKLLESMYTYHNLGK